MIMSIGIISEVVFLVEGGRGDGSGREGELEWRSK